MWRDSGNIAILYSLPFWIFINKNYFGWEGSLDRTRPLLTIPTRIYIKSKINFISYDFVYFWIFRNITISLILPFWSLEIHLIY